jgi:hypothetical protein
MGQIRANTQRARNPACPSLCDVFGFGLFIAKLFPMGGSNDCEFGFLMYLVTLMNE